MYGGGDMQKLFGRVLELRGEAAAASHAWEAVVLQLQRRLQGAEGSLLLLQVEAEYVVGPRREEFPRVIDALADRAAAVAVIALGAASPVRAAWLLRLLALHYPGAVAYALKPDKLSRTLMGMGRADAALLRTTSEHRPPRDPPPGTKQTAPMRVAALACEAFFIVQGLLAAPRRDAHLVLPTHLQDHPGPMRERYLWLRKAQSVPCDYKHRLVAAAPEGWLGGLLQTALCITPGLAQGEVAAAVDGSRAAAMWGVVRRIGAGLAAQEALAYLMSAAVLPAVVAALPHFPAAVGRFVAECVVRHPAGVGDAAPTLCGLLARALPLPHKDALSTFVLLAAVALADGKPWRDPSVQSHAADARSPPTMFITPIHAHAGDAAQPRREVSPSRRARSKSVGPLTTATTGSGGLLLPGGAAGAPSQEEPVTPGGEKKKGRRKRGWSLMSILGRAKPDAQGDDAHGEPAAATPAPAASPPAAAFTPPAAAVHPYFFTGAFEFVESLLRGEVHTAARRPEATPMQPRPEPETPTGRGRPTMLNFSQLNLSCDDTPQDGSPRTRSPHRRGGGPRERAVAPVEGDASVPGGEPCDKDSKGTPRRVGRTDSRASAGGSERQHAASLPGDSATLLQGSSAAPDEGDPDVAVVFALGAVAGRVVDDYALQERQRGVLESVVASLEAELPPAHSHRLRRRLRERCGRGGAPPWDAAPWTLQHTPQAAPPSPVRGAARRAPSVFSFSGASLRVQVAWLLLLAELAKDGGRAAQHVVVQGFFYTEAAGPSAPPPAVNDALCIALLALARRRYALIPAEPAAPQLTFPFLCTLAGISGGASEDVPALEAAGGGDDDTAHAGPAVALALGIVAGMCATAWVAAGAAAAAPPVPPCFADAAFFPARALEAVAGMVDVCPAAASHAARIRGDVAAWSERWAAHTAAAGIAQRAWRAHCSRRGVARSAAGRRRRMAAVLIQKTFRGALARARYRAMVTEHRAALRGEEVAARSAVMDAESAARAGLQAAVASCNALQTDPFMEAEAAARGALEAWERFERGETTRRGVLWTDAVIALIEFADECVWGPSLRQLRDEGAASPLRRSPRRREAAQEALERRAVRSLRVVAQLEEVARKDLLARGNRALAGHLAAAQRRREQLHLLKAALLGADGVAAAEAAAWSQLRVDNSLPTLLQDEAVGRGDAAAAEGAARGALRAAECASAERHARRAVARLWKRDLRAAVVLWNAGATRAGLADAAVTAAALVLAVASSRAGGAAPATKPRGEPLRKEKEKKRATGSAGSRATPKSAQPSGAAAAGHPRHVVRQQTRTRPKSAGQTRGATPPSGAPPAERGMSSTYYDEALRAKEGRELPRARRRKRDPPAGGKPRKMRAARAFDDPPLTGAHIFSDDSDTYGCDWRGPAAEELLSCSDAFGGAGAGAGAQVSGWETSALRERPVQRRLFEREVADSATSFACTTERGTDASSGQLSPGAAPRRSSEMAKPFRPLDLSFHTVGGGALSPRTQLRALLAAHDAPTATARTDPAPRRHSLVDDRPLQGMPARRRRHHPG